MNPLFCIKTNKRIILQKQIASSGEGEIWTTEDPTVLAKIYHRATIQRQEKLRVMFKHPPQDPNSERNHISFAWPQSLLVDKTGKILGFLMAKIHDGRELIDIYNPRRRNKLKVKVDWHFLHVVSHNIASIIHAIHQAGYVLGDIKPQNILVNSQAVPSIIDTDSFQVTNPTTGNIYRCLVGSEGFTPPELLNQDFAQINQTEVHDRFRLGVIIYYLLFGSHPFQGKWVGQGESPEITELIRQGYWVFASNGLIKPSSLTIPLTILHPVLKDCFIRCFSDGYKNPRSRPTAKDWQQSLQIAIKELKQCGQENQHFYHEKQSSCYWCQRKEQLKMDIFGVAPKVPVATPASKRMMPKREEIPLSSRPRVNRAPHSSPYFVSYPPVTNYRPSPLTAFKAYLKNTFAHNLNRYTALALGNASLLASFLIILALFQGLPESRPSISRSSSLPDADTPTVSKHKKVASFYNDRGYQKYNDKDYIGAIADFNQALKLDPGLADSYYNRGLANQALGYDKLAEQDLYKAISLDPRVSNSTDLPANSNENLEVENVEDIALEKGNFMDNEPFKLSPAAQANLNQRLGDPLSIEQQLERAKTKPSASERPQANPSPKSTEKLLQALDANKTSFNTKTNLKKPQLQKPTQSEKQVTPKQNEASDKTRLTVNSHLAFSLFQRGVINRRQGNYQEAITNFEQAYFLLKKENNPALKDLEKMIQDLQKKTAP
ncbi:MAG: tetratricopeptide repeat protein [Snowella sp.]|nr:tetratricopeptide repeat protein [Snowella sp.]